MKKSFYLPGLFVVCSLFFSIAAGAVVPTITTNPANDTVCTGTNAKFIVAANDTPDTSPITFRWQVSTDGGTTWSTITDTTFYHGTTNDTLVVTASPMLNGDWYRCIATDTSGSDTSLGGLLVVNFPASAIAGASPVCSGSSITLTDVVAGGIWSRNHPAIDTVTPGGVLTGLSVGYDTVTYMVTNTCGVTVASADIRVDVPASALPVTGPTTTCIGHTVTLDNANTVGTWVWSASNASASIAHDGTLTGISFGLDTISYVFTNACNSVTSTLAVQVDTLLAHGVISGPSSVCTGSWIHLTESIGGGIWLSSSSGTAVVDGSGNVTGISQGIVVISYLFSNGCGASIAIDTITVQREASVITGLDSVGIGATRTLSDSTLGGVWSISDTTATIGSSSGVVTGVAAGSATVTYTVNNVCGTSMAMFLMHIGNAPSIGGITGPDSVCIGAHITLADSALGGIWTTAFDTVATIDSSTGIVTGIAAGSVAISYIYTNAFGRDTVYKTVYVNHKPVISLSGPNIVAIGGNYFFRATPPHGAFHVSNPSVGVIIATSDSATGGVSYASFASYIQLTAGSNTMHYVFTNNCGSADSTFVMYLAPGVNVKNVAGPAPVLNVYPNPNQGEFTMNLVSSVSEDVVVTVTNIVGEKVKDFTVSTNSTSAIKLDQPSGLYFLTANTSAGRYTAKITIAK